MKNLLKLIKQKLTKWEITFLVILQILFFYSRLFNLEQRTSFGADQEDLAYRAIELLSGDPVLLGPVTSVNGFAIGPLFTYLWTAFSLPLRGDPLAGNLVAIFLGSLTLTLLYIATRIFFGRNFAIFAPIVYLFSFSFYQWDISPWAPSLFYISQTLILLGAYLSLSRASGYIVVALGFALGFSAHITIFMSLFGVFIFWLFYRPVAPSKKVLIQSVAIIFLGILPNFIFDITHKFVNILRLLTNFKDPEPENVATSLKVIMSLIKVSALSFVPSVDISIAVVIFAIIIFGSLLIYILRKEPIVLLFYFALFIGPVIFLFWRGNFSEYYLMGSILPALFLAVYLYKSILTKFFVLGLPLLALFIYPNFLAWQSMVRPLNLWAMKKIVKTAVDMAQGESYGVSLTTEFGYSFGYKYLFHYFGSYPDIPPKKGETRIITIVVPPGFRGVNAKIEHAGVGLLWEGIKGR